MRLGRAWHRFAPQLALGSTQRGLALLALVCIIALMAVGMYRVVTSMAYQKQRDQEQLLLRIGRSYAMAIQAYRQAAPGSVTPYPLELSQLTRDSRFASVQRYLRDVYPDPMQPDKPWGVIRNASGGIIGVFSTSELSPFLQTVDAPTSGAQHYFEWKFLAKDIP